MLHSLSFVEDPTRVFRAVRFEQRFGFSIGKFTVNLIKNAVKMSFLAKIKGARIWREVSLMLLEADPGAIMRRLQELDLTRFIYPTFAFDAEKEKLFREMDTVLKWYNLSFKGKYNRVFYYLFGLDGPHVGGADGRFSKTAGRARIDQEEVPQRGIAVAASNGEPLGRHLRL